MTPSSYTSNRGTTNHLCSRALSMGQLLQLRLILICIVSRRAGGLTGQIETDLYDWQSSLSLRLLPNSSHLWPQLAKHVWKTKHVWNKSLSHRVHVKGLPEFCHKSQRQSTLHLARQAWEAGGKFRGERIALQSQLTGRRGAPHRESPHHIGGILFQHQKVLVHLSP